MTPTINNLMQDLYKRVARTVVYCLTLGLEAEDWNSLTVVLSNSLTLDERLAFAWAAMRALPPDVAADVAKTVLPYSAGIPVPPLGDPLGEAAFWVSVANPDEREAYCLATFNAMPSNRQAAFLDYVQGRQAA
ncbi:hypothetical protein AB0T83_17855 [Fluviibacterium sp. DFM31]|uniref:Uncharacterized protein n=1 Tax=Meridianimarinicoccus marinus TaxID=3231483 RepID=A0ABV3LB09_9RHOB